MKTPEKLKIKEVILPKHPRKLRLQVDYSDKGWVQFSCHYL